MILIRRAEVAHQPPLKERGAGLVAPQMKRNQFGEVPAQPLRGGNDEEPGAEVGGHPFRRWAADENHQISREGSGIAGKAPPHLSQLDGDPLPEIVGQGAVRSYVHPRSFNNDRFPLGIDLDEPQLVLDAFPFLLRLSEARSRRFPLAPQQVNPSQITRNRASLRIIGIGGHLRLPQ